MKTVEVRWVYGCLHGWGEYDASGMSDSEALFKLDPFQKGEPLPYPNALD